MACTVCNGRFINASIALVNYYNNKHKKKEILILFTTKGREWQCCLQRLTTVGLFLSLNKKMTLHYYFSRLNEVKIFYDSKTSMGGNYQRMHL